jgi:hypothetical protein
MEECVRVRLSVIVNQSRSLTSTMSDTSSDDTLDGLVEEVEENLNESDADDEVDVDEDAIEVLEGDLAERASDGDEVMSHSVVGVTCTNLE